jgi:CRP-like cAMP-binding protein
MNTKVNEAIVRQYQADYPTVPLKHKDIYNQSLRESFPISSEATPSFKRAFAKGEFIPTLEDKLWLIQEGIARTLTFSEDGNATGLGYWGKGDVIGQPLSNLAGHQIECVTPVETILLDCEDWSKYINAILRNTQQKALIISILGQKQVFHRLVDFLSYLGDRFGKPVSKGLLIDIPLSHDTLSEMIGANRVTVTRYLGELQNQGALIKRPCQIVLLKDLKKLSLQTISPCWSKNQNPAQKVA